MSAAVNRGSPSASSRSMIWPALIAVYIFWGSTYLAIRFAVQTIPPFMMAAVRFLIAGGLLYVVRRWRGDPAPSRREWGSAAIIGILLLASGNGVVVWAEQRISSGLAALLVSTVPLFMMAIEILRPGGRWPGWPVIAGLLAGFAGAAILVGPVSSGGDAGNSLAAGISLLGALSWSIGSLYSRKAALPSSPLLGTSMEMLAGGSGLLLMSLASGEWARLSLPAISTRSLLGLVYLVVFGSWVGFGAYTWLLRSAPTSLVSTYAYVNPVIAVLLGYLLGSEPLGPRTLIATVMIVGAVAAVSLFRRPEAPAQPAAPGGAVAPQAANTPCSD